jgi:tetratricopeptide (TPR) repeat protein
MTRAAARAVGCRWTLIGALVCALGMLGTGTARAQAGKGGRATAEQRAEAELFFRAGEQAFNAGQYLVASQAFEQAFEVLPLPAILFSTAQAYRLQYFIDKEVTHLLRSIELYRKYIQEVDQGGRRDDAATSLAELEVIRDRLQREGRLKSRRDSVELEDKTQLMVTTQVEGAKASIDGKAGETPLILEVQPGKHRVEVQADGYFAASQQATAVTGRLVVIEVALQPMPARLTVDAEPGASIHVDGRALATTPLSRPLEIPAGKHFVAITRRGRYPWARELELTHGKSLDLRTRLETTSQRRISFWVLGASGLSLVTAAGVGVLAYRADGELADLVERYEVGGISQAEADAIRAAGARRDTRLRITYAFVGASVVTALAGGLLYWFDTPQISTAGMSTGNVDSPRDKASSLRIAPLIDANQAGFAVAGHF